MDSFHCKTCCKKNYLSRLYSAFLTTGIYSELCEHIHGAKGGRPPCGGAEVGHHKRLERYGKVYILGQVSAVPKRLSANRVFPPKQNDKRLRRFLLRLETDCTV